MNKTKTFFKMACAMLVMISFLGTSSVQASELDSTSAPENTLIPDEMIIPNDYHFGDLEEGTEITVTDATTSEPVDENKEAVSSNEVATENAEKVESEKNKSDVFWGYNEGYFDQEGIGHDGRNYVMLKEGLPYTPGSGDIVYCLNENRDAPAALAQGKSERTPVKYFIQRNFSEEDIKAYIDEEKDFDVKQKLSQVVLAGYNNNLLDFKGELSDNEFRMATQEAIWHFTKADYNPISLSPNVQDVYEKLVGEENTVAVPEGFNLVLYEYMGNETKDGYPLYQNFLGSKIIKERIDVEPKHPEKPKKSEEPKVPESPKKPEEPKTPEAPKKPEEPKTPEAPKKPEEPKAPESPKKPEKPSVERSDKPKHPRAERPHTDGGGHSSWSGNKPKTEITITNRGNEEPSKEETPIKPENVLESKKEQPKKEVEIKESTPKHQDKTTVRENVPDTPKLPKTGTSRAPFALLVMSLLGAALINNRKFFKFD